MRVEAGRYRRRETGKGETEIDREEGGRKRETGRVRGEVRDRKRERGGLEEWKER